jgi:hypothetical protein
MDRPWEIDDAVTALEPARGRTARPVAASVIPARSPRRGLTIIAAGLLALGTIVAPAVAAPASPAAHLATRAASCAGLSFYPLESGTNYMAHEGIRVRHWEGGGNGYFVCDPGLPHGAVVTKVQFTVLDGSDVGETRNCALVRVSLQPAQDARVQVLGKVQDSGKVFAHTSPTRFTTTQISYATIDLSRYGYWFQCRLEGRYGAELWTGIVGAAATFTISEAKG